MTGLRDSLLERVVLPLFLLVLTAVFTALGIDAASSGTPRALAVAWWVVVVAAMAAVQVGRARRGTLILRRGGGVGRSDDIEGLGWLLFAAMVVGVVPFGPVRAVCLTAVGGFFLVWTLVGTWTAWVVRPGPDDVRGRR